FITSATSPKDTEVIVHLSPLTTLTATPDTAIPTTHNPNHPETVVIATLIPLLLIILLTCAIQYIRLACAAHKKHQCWPRPDISTLPDGRRVARLASNAANAATPAQHDRNTSAQHSRRWSNETSWSGLVERTREVDRNPFEDDGDGDEMPASP